MMTKRMMFRTISQNEIVCHREEKESYDVDFRRFDKKLGQTTEKVCDMPQFYL